MTRAYIAILCAILSAGCITSDSILVVQPDGSGTVTNTVFFKLEVIELETSFKRGTATRAEGADFFTEEKMRDAGRRMGEGVTFQSMQPLKKDGWEGARVTYTFTDISKLTLVTGAQAVQTLTEGASSLITFRFVPATAAAPAKLTIVMPIKEASEERARANDRPPPRDPAAEKAEMERLKPLVEGARQSIVVEVGGPIVKTNADSVAGSRIPLQTVDMDQFLASGADFMWFTEIRQGTMSFAEARRKMKSTKGLWMQLRPEVSVEFGRK